MIKEVEFSLRPRYAREQRVIKKAAATAAGVDQLDISHLEVVKRSIDARKKPVYRFKARLYIDEPYLPKPSISEKYQSVEDCEELIIVGAGPAGYFCALECLELGLKPIVYERGKDVQARRRDLRAIQQFGLVNPHSNYCFGEGGAGTYSDGKLYTRSNKRGVIHKAIQILVEHGASEDILIDAHPHIGSNKLPRVVANIRETILHHGGEIHFDCEVTDFIVEDGAMAGVIVNNNHEKRANGVVLATGHSARKIFSLLLKHEIKIEEKPFAVGVRIEHPQRLIDKIQYGQSERGPYLPAASYRLACQVGQNGVYSFCMCPGGLIVPAATAPGEIVINGMSLSRRDSPFANAGTVTTVDSELKSGFEKHGVLAGLKFQAHLEQSAFNVGDGSQQAPAQRLTDFVSGKYSQSLPDSSYIPGLFSHRLDDLLPALLVDRLRKGVLRFGKMMKGYYARDAVVVAVESRTSCPIRIPRKKEGLMHTEMAGLFPCGEGAGYAGGIISAAIDGQNVANAAAQFYHTVQTVTK